MIFNRTFRQENTIQEATELLDLLITGATDMELLADQLRFFGFITNLNAIKLAGGEGWTVEELSEDVWERHTRTSGRFSKVGA